MVTGRAQPREDFVSHNGLRQAVGVMRAILAAIMVGQKNAQQLPASRSPQAEVGEIKAASSVVVGYLSPLTPGAAGALGSSSWW
jgi:hypothetical protein